MKSRRIPAAPIKLGFLSLLLIWGLLTLAFFDRREVAFQSRESKTPSQSPVFNQIKWFRFPTKEVWMMNQSHYGSNAEAGAWDRLAIVVETDAPAKTARFYQLEPGPLEWQENPKELSPRVSCFMCHPNGPRAIRADDASAEKPISLWNRMKILAWNLRIKSYGRIELDPIHDERDGNLETPVRWRGEFDNQTLDISACNHCHNENGYWARGKLRRQNILTIRFMVETGAMPPPGFSLKPQEERVLSRFLSGF